MAGRKLVRDLFLSRKTLLLQPLYQPQVSRTRLRLLSPNEYSGNRQFSVFNEFSKKIKDETKKNPEFQQSVKQLKEKAEELKGVKENLKVRTKQTTEKLYKQVDGVWTEAEATAKKVSADVKEKISVATEEVKGTFGIGKQESSESTGTSAEEAADVKYETKASGEEETSQHSGRNDSAETLLGKFKSALNVGPAYQRIKDAKFVDLAKKGYDILKDELNGSPKKRKHLQYEPSPSPQGGRSTRTDIVVVPTKQSRWSKKWEAFKLKMQGYPLFKRVSGYSEPVLTKGQEIAEDVRERWETSDSPIVHKIQDLNETIFQETDSAATMKEIHLRDPSFSLPEFVAEVQEAVKPVLSAYMKGDTETLKKYCTSEVIERCKAEHSAYQSHGIFFDNKILHVSEVVVHATKMMGASPIIIIMFQTQQIHCVRDRNGVITEGGKDTIHTTTNLWAMQQVNPEDLGEDALYPIWRLREFHQLGSQALI